MTKWIWYGHGLLISSSFILYFSVRTLYSCGSWNRKKEMALNYDKTIGARGKEGIYIYTLCVRHSEPMREIKGKPARHFVIHQLRIIHTIYDHS